MQERDAFVHFIMENARTSIGKGRISKWLRTKKQIPRKIKMKLLT